MLCHRESNLVLHLHLPAMNNRASLLALYAFVPFGPMRTRLLLKYFGNARKAWGAKLSDLIDIGLSQKIVGQFAKHRQEFNIENYLSRLASLGIQFVVYTDSIYPKQLTSFDDAPLILYFKGSLALFDNECVAIVGSRKMTSYGREVTQLFATQLALSQVVIISGLARGVDTIAHESALQVGGYTAAIVAGGLDKMYPPENTGLAQRIVKSKGCVISEYPLGYPARRENFASRNRLISGLASSVLVVEGQLKSGTLLTAAHAGRQGKTVFAIPGQITSPNSAAPHYLLQNGALGAYTPEDILTELGVDKKQSNDVEKRVQPDKFEAQLLAIIATEPLHLDEIVRISTLATQTVSARLTVMELKGLVKNIGNGVYKKIK